MSVWFYRRDLGEDRVRSILQTGWAPLQDADSFLADAPDGFEVVGVDAKVATVGDPRVSPTNARLEVTVNLHKGRSLVQVTFSVAEVGISISRGGTPRGGRTLADPFAEEVWAAIHDLLTRVERRDKRATDEEVESANIIEAPASAPAGSGAPGAAADGGVS